MVNTIEKKQFVRNHLSSLKTEREYFEEKQIAKVKTNSGIRYLYILTSFFNRNRIDVNDIINHGNEGFN